jgi:hypothetical protein
MILVMTLSQLVVIFDDRWIQYWYSKESGKEFKNALLKMMYDLFNEKIASELEEIPVTATTEIEVDVCNGDDFLRQQMLMRRKDEWKSGNGHTEIQQRVEQILEEEIESYLKFISNIDYVDLIQRYPSKLYDEKTFRKDQVAVVKDPIYTASMFDTFRWWRDSGRERYKYIEVCALIVLAKPIHNGFQERVFSRGTFTDDQLRRRMKESTFELSILESINCDVVDKYMEIFKQKENTSPAVLEEKVENFLKCNQDIDDMSDVSASGDNEEYCVEVDDNLEDLSDDDYMSEECLKTRF